MRAVVRLVLEVVEAAREARAGAAAEEARARGKDEAESSDRRHGPRRDPLVAAWAHARARLGPEDLPLDDLLLDDRDDHGRRRPLTHDRALDLDRLRVRPQTHDRALDRDRLRVRADGRLADADGHLARHHALKRGLYGLPLTLDRLRLVLTHDLALDRLRLVLTHDLALDRLLLLVPLHGYCPGDHRRSRRRLHRENWRHTLESRRVTSTK